MPQGTYADESPDASIGERLANSISKIKQALVAHPGPMTANDAEEPQVQNTDDNAKLGRMKQAQSSDRDNSYSY